jgi:hypothetical protein
VSTLYGAGGGAWRKSSHSDSSGGACVEVAACGAGPERAVRAVRIRDSKRPAAAQLRVSPASWRSFVAFTRRPPQGRRASR